jgi:hypothetical protein
VVPSEEVSAEQTLMEVSFNNAKATVTSLIQQGKDDSACRDLAATTAKEVTESVAASQKALSQLPSGAQCDGEGQTLITTANSNKEAADKAKEDAQEALTAAQDSDLDFGKFKYSSLTEGQCGSFFNSQVWQDAKNKVNAAQTAYDTAVAEANAAAKAVTDAKTAAAELVKTCLCNTKKSLDDAVTNMNADAKAANTEAWNKAHHMECVLDGKTTDNCDVPPLPMVEPVAYGDGVAGACGGQGWTDFAADAGSWGSMRGNQGNDGHGDHQCKGASFDENLQKIAITSGTSAWHQGCWAKKMVKSMGDLPVTFSGQYNQNGANNNAHYSNSGYMWLGFDNVKNNGGGQPHYDCNFDFGLRLQTGEVAKAAVGGGCRTETITNSATIAVSGHQAYNFEIHIAQDGVVTNNFWKQGTNKPQPTVASKKAVESDFPLFIDVDPYGYIAYVSNMKFT